MRDLDGASHYEFFQNMVTRELHRFVVTDGERFTKEECNTDDILEGGAVEEAVVEQLLALGASRCGHCFKAEEPAE